MNKNVYLTITCASKDDGTDAYGLPPDLASGDSGRIWAEAERMYTRYSEAAQVVKAAGRVPIPILRYPWGVNVGITRFVPGDAIRKGADRTHNARVICNAFSSRGVSPLVYIGTDIAPNVAYLPSQIEELAKKYMYDVPCAGVIGDTWACVDAFSAPGQLARVLAIQCRHKLGVEPSPYMQWAATWGRWVLSDAPTLLRERARFERLYKDAEESNPRRREGWARPEFICNHEPGTITDEQASSIRKAQREMNAAVAFGCSPVDSVREMLAAIA